RKERDQYTHALPWGGNSWFQLDFLAAVFPDLDTVAATERDLIRIPYYGFDGDKAKQNQLINFNYAYRNEAIIVRSALHDIIVNDALELQRFFQWIHSKEKGRELPTPNSQLTFLNALLWYQKDTHHLSRGLYLTPQITYDESHEEDLPEGVSTNLDVPIDVKKLMKKALAKQPDSPAKASALRALEAIPVLNATQRTLRAAVRAMSATDTKATATGPGAASTKKAKGPMDFAVEADGRNLSLASKRLLNNSTRDLDWEILDSRYAALRRIQRLGENFCGRNLSDKLAKSNLDLYFKLLELLRNALTHQDQCDRDIWAANLETSPDVIEKIFKDLQTFKLGLFESIVERQQKFSILKEKYSGYISWQGDGARYWSQIKSFYAEAVAQPVVEPVFGPLLPLHKLADSLSLLKDAAQVQYWKGIFNGSTAFPDKLAINQSDLITLARSKKSNSLKQFQQYFNEANKRRNILKGEHQASQAAIKKAQVESRRKLIGDDTPSLFNIQLECEALLRDHHGYIPAERMAKLVRKRFFELKKLIFAALRENDIDLKQEGVEKKFAGLLDENLVLLDAFSYLSGQLLILINGLSTHPAFAEFSYLSSQLEKIIQYRNYLEHDNAVIDTKDTPYRTMSKVNAGILGAFIFNFIRSAEIECCLLVSAVAKHELSKCDFRELPVPGRGDCLFESLIHACKRHKIKVNPRFANSAKLRKAVAKHLNRNQALYKERVASVLVDLIINKSFAGIKTPELYVKIRAISNEYHGNIEREIILEERKTILSRAIIAFPSIDLCSVDEASFVMITSQEIQAIRQELADIKHYQERFSINAVNEAVYGLYVKEISTAGAWANELELDIAAKLLKLHVNVYSNTSTDNRAEFFIVQGADYNQQAVRVVNRYNVGPKNFINLIHCNANHYNVLQALRPIGILRSDERARALSFYDAIYQMPIEKGGQKQANALMPE
ncbi:MAG: hypothetical protein K0Q57_1193, partial [Gammaproteobacteria bacterium]|nr:hypothetical protein [Gammaproteobacteria bacterium]